MQKPTVTAEEEGSFDVSLELKKDYQLEVQFGQAGVDRIVVDEPPPIGSGAGPAPTRLLAAALLTCLSESLIYCLRRARIEVTGLKASAHSIRVRNEQGRLRIGRIQVTLEPAVLAEDRPRMSRCLDVFENYCVVTQSVRPGIEVDVTVV